MWALRRKSSIALVAGIIALLLLLLLWYTLLVPFIVASQLEKLDTTTAYNGTLEYLGYGIPKIPIQVEAYARVSEVKGDNIILWINVTIMNVTEPSRPNILSEFSRNSTYVLNKFSRENVKNAPEADKAREGYDPIYPPHLEAGEDISNAWLDLSNVTAPLQFQGSTIEEGITLYRYFANKTITKSMTIPRISARALNYTFTSIKMILVEPVSGVPAYSENETFSFFLMPELPLIYLTYNSTAEARTQGIANAKAAYEGMQLLESYIPIIPVVIVIILVIGLTLNLRRLRGKKSPKQEAQSSASTESRSSG